MDEHASSELLMILERYNLGDLIGFYPDERGTVNTSFTIETQKNNQRKKYFFRRYKKGIDTSELLFEHSIISHLISKGFNIVARVIPTRDGGSFVHIKDEGANNDGVFYAIFDFMPGEDRYTWIDPICSASEIASAATVLANFHKTLYGFSPSGARQEQRIMDLLPVLYERLDQCASRARGGVFDAYFQDNLPAIRQNLLQTRDSLEGCLVERCVELVIHCDYHPGNLKFSNEHVVALFDLDWSKIEYRCFDVALAIYYFFTSWQASRDGELRVEEVRLFLETYQNATVGDTKPGPLTMVELRCLPDMIAAANLYVLNWTILDYINKDVDPAEYRVYLEHGVKTILWMEDNHHQSLLRAVIHHVDTDK